MEVLRRDIGSSYEQKYALSIGFGMAETDPEAELILHVHPNDLAVVMSIIT